MCGPNEAQNYKTGLCFPSGLIQIFFTFDICQKFGYCSTL